MADKTILKNTLFLYFRMMLVMFVSLYTSRVILKNLGIVDYGIYQAVGGIVTLFSFLNSALSSGSSRFLTIGLGKGNFSELKNIFSTLFIIHILLAFFIVFLGETLGVFIFEKKIVIEEARMTASRFVFHFSIITCFFTIIQVPYTSLIIAHEDLSIYAYIGIVEVILKLLVAFTIKYSSYDKLIIYAMLLCLVQFIIAGIYIIYCLKKYKESIYNKKLIKLSVFKSVASYSSWSLFSNAAISIVNQGTLILLNNFYTPIVVSARSVALIVTNTANQFINNFRTAANPQILKKYAVGDFDGSKNLLLESTSFSYYLMLVISIPIYLLAEPLLRLWLGEVPAYSVLFLEWGVIQSLFSVFDTSFFVALTAKGRLKENSLISPSIGLLQFPVIYLFFKLNFGPEIVCYVSCIVYAILGLIVKPILIVKIANYNYSEIYRLIGKCLILTLITGVPCLYISKLFNANTIKGFLAIGIISVVIVCLGILFFGLDKEQRKKLTKFIKDKLIKA